MPQEMRSRFWYVLLERPELAQQLLVSQQPILLSAAAASAAFHLTMVQLPCRHACLDVGFANMARWCAVAAPAVAHSVAPVAAAMACHPAELDTIDLDFQVRTGAAHMRKLTA
jgi:hypothetical protein